MGGNESELCKQGASAAAEGLLNDSWRERGSCRLHRRSPGGFRGGWGEDREKELIIWAIPEADGGALTSGGQGRTGLRQRERFKQRHRGEMLLQSFYWRGKQQLTTCPFQRSRADQVLYFTNRGPSRGLYLLWWREVNMAKSLEARCTMKHTATVSWVNTAQSKALLQTEQRQKTTQIRWTNRDSLYW